MFVVLHTAKQFIF